jgi:hypothetical protein
MEFPVEHGGCFKFSLLGARRKDSGFKGFAAFHFVGSRSNSALRIRSKAADCFPPVGAAIRRISRRATGVILVVIRSLLMVQL